MHDIDRNGIKEATEKLIESLGYDINDEHFTGTPDRVVRMWEEILSDDDRLNDPPLFQRIGDLVILKGVNFYSFCSHHIVPWFGEAHIAYIPNEEITGLSKIARCVRDCSKGLTIQEKVTESIAESVMKLTNCNDVMVVIKARHLCMQARGIKSGAETITSAVRGDFVDMNLKLEMLKLLEV